MANNCWHTWKPFFKRPKYPNLPQLTKPNRNPLLVPYAMYGSLKERRVKGRKVVRRRVRGNDYPPSCLDVFKIK